MKASFVCFGVALVSFFFASKGFPCEGQNGPHAANQNISRKAQRRVASAGVDAAFAQRVKSKLVTEEPGIEETGVEVASFSLKGEAYTEFQNLQGKNGGEFPPAAHQLKIDGRDVIVVSQYAETGLALAAFLPDGSLIAKGASSESGEFVWN
jgi:hypothetical protein